MTELVREWRGHPSAVRQSVALARQRGQLVDEQWLPARPGTAAVRVRLRLQALPAGRVRRSLPRVPYRWVAAGVGVPAGAVVTGWVVWQAATAAAAWLVDHVAHLVGGAAVLGLVLALLAGVAGGGSGHCSGPGTGH